MLIDASPNSGFPQDPGNSRHSGRSRSRPTKLPWLQVAKSRKSVSEKVTWDGTRMKFRPFKSFIESHIIQCLAGYILHPSFKTKFTLQGDLHLNSLEFWHDFQVHLNSPDINGTVHLILPLELTLSHLLLTSSKLSPMALPPLMIASCRLGSASSSASSCLATITSN